MPFIDRGGVAIHYEATGSGDTVLFTHGFGATAAMFSGNLAAIAGRRQAVTWDLRGHGESAYPDDPAQYSVPLSLDDMAAVLDEVGAGRAVLAGHSLGGFLSLAFHAALPERVSGLVLVDTGPGYRQDDGARPGIGWPRSSPPTSRLAVWRPGHRARRRPRRSIETPTVWRSPRAAS